MRKHDEDLWDFRSDPVFGKSKPDKEPVQKSNSEDAEYTEYKEDYVDILRTSTAKDSSLDNMTFVMKDGKASFIDNSLLEQEKEEPKAKEIPNKAVPVNHNTQPEQPPVPAPAISEEQNAAEDSESVCSSSDTHEVSENSAAEPTTVVISNAEEVPVQTENIEAEVSPAIISDTNPPTDSAESDNQKNIGFASAPATAEKTVKKSEAPKFKKPEAKKTATPSPSKPAHTSKTETKVSDIPAKSDNSKPEVTLKEETPVSETTATKKKVPATDNDFIFAKPHSKKKHHHSHHSHSHSHSHSDSNEEQLPEDKVDDYVYARYRKQSSKKNHHHLKKSPSDEYIRTSGNEDTPVVCSTTATHFRSNRKRKKKDRKWHRRPWWQKLLIILGWIFGVILVLALIALVLFLIFSRIGINDMTNYDDVQIKPPAFESVDVQIEDNGKIHIYNGKKYRLNTDIANILCIGVDKKYMDEDKEAADNSTLARNGQSDALFMVALNTKTGKTKVLSIPRDTMADINIYNSDGKFLKTDNLQICQAFAYGYSNKAGTQNTKDAVSRLFYQMPIQTYFAMDLSAIATLNDTIGGVTVTMIDDSFYDTNHIHYKKGETITLHGDNARKYVQQRDVNQLESTTNRLKRQTQYLKAFSSQALAMTKQDLSIPVTLYNQIEARSVSNVDVYKISAIARCLIENGVSSLDFETIPGELQSDGTYAQYIVDEEKFYELWLETYCVPVE